MKKLEAQRKEEILAPSLQLAVGGEVANTGAFLPSPTLFTKLPGLELCTPGKLTKKHLHSREEASRGRRKSESLPGKESSQEPFPFSEPQFPQKTATPARPLSLRRRAARGRAGLVVSAPLGSGVPAVYVPASAQLTPLRLPQPIGLSAPCQPRHPVSLSGQTSDLSYADSGHLTQNRPLRGTSCHNRKRLVRCAVLPSRSAAGRFRLRAASQGPRGLSVRFFREHRSAWGKCR